MIYNWHIIEKASSDIKNCMERMILLKYLKIKLDTNLKIILLDY